MRYGLTADYMHQKMDGQTGIFGFDKKDVLSISNPKQAKTQAKRAQVQHSFHARAGD